MRIFKISLIDSPIDAFEGGIAVFGIIKKKSYGWGGGPLKLNKKTMAVFDKMSSFFIKLGIHLILITGQKSKACQI